MDLGHHRVVIAGAGPVGLFLASRLVQLGIRPLVLEQQERRPPQSRAIGIHPPSLERLQRMGLSDTFVSRGVQITAGVARDGPRTLGRLSFESCPPPFRFVLALPQHESESILAGPLGDARRCGCRLESFEPDRDGLRFQARTAAGGRLTGRCEYLVGCDGPRSTVRRVAGIDVVRRPYPDRYAMADFPGDPLPRSEGHVHLHANGLVESFPLPGDIRRWVVKWPADRQAATVEDLVATVRRRTGHDISGRSPVYFSRFRAHRSLADRFRVGRVALAGDAAHEMSPFGGQGMNIGWMDAWDLADALAAILMKGARPDERLEAYHRRARRRARWAIRRAEWNMALGRESPRSAGRNRLVALLLTPPLNRLLARAFTLRWL